MLLRVDNYLKNYHLWVIFARNSFLQTLSNRSMVIIFVTAKILRISLFVTFLLFLFRGASNLAGYTRDQIIFFYLAFQLIDSVAQFFFRTVYSFRPLVVSGDLDLVLIKPINPLTRVLWGGPDVLDLITLIPLIFISIWFAVSAFHPQIINWLGFFLLFLNSLVIAASLHITVLGLGIITMSVDHFILIYRDFTSLMRIPVDLYIEPLRSLLTFVIPIGIMITFPPKLLLGLLSPTLFFVSVAFSILSLYLSLRFWHYSLSRYQSAGS
jgi:ABC-2 type transport system permease protein